MNKHSVSTPSRSFFRNFIHEAVIRKRTPALFVRRTCRSNHTRCFVGCSSDKHPSASCPGLGGGVASDHVGKGSHHNKETNLSKRTLHDNGLRLKFGDSYPACVDCMSCIIIAIVIIIIASNLVYRGASGARPTTQ